MTAKILAGSAISNLDRALLVDALIGQTRRLERVMKEAGFPDEYIRVSTEYEYSLANRALLSLEGMTTEQRRTA